MDNENPILTERQYNSHQIHRICWSAIFTGALVGIGLGFLLHLYGVAISLSAFSSTEHGAPAIAIGGLLGMLIGVIAAMATAGFVAGHLGRYHYYPVHGGVIYGFITWSLIIVLSAIMAGPLMHYAEAYEKSISPAVEVESPKAEVINNATTNDTNVPQLKHTNTNAPVVEVTPTALAWGGWIVFLLFFVGALSSCIGACCAMRCKREEL